MHTLTKLTFVLLMTAVASVTIVAQQRSDLVGSYVFRFEWGGKRLTLKKNGTFAAGSSDCTGVTTQYGPYSVSNNVVRLKTVKLTRRSYDSKKEYDLTKRKPRKEFLDTNEPFKPESWALQIMRWGERVYLLDEDNFGNLIEAINLGFEPRSVEGYSAFYGAIYLREGDENKPAAVPPPLPAEFLRDLLPEPVVATILEIKTEGQHSIATIDRGSADGLREKMTLVPTIPTFDYRAFWIKSIAEHSAQLFVYGDIKVGDQLTTRVTDVRRYSE